MSLLDSSRDMPPTSRQINFDFNNESANQEGAGGIGPAMIGQSMDSEVSIGID